MKKDTEKESVVYDDDEFLKDHTDYQTMEYTGDPEKKAAYKRLLSKRVREGSLVAMEIYAYFRYNGNSVYKQDFKETRDVLLRLIDEADPPAPFWYNTLGYIYYYGRTNRGIPEYDKALQYFTVAAMNGVYEAQYKLADMMITGKGLPKNAAGAATILDRLYGENRTLLENEKFDCKFADVALRVGTMYRDGIGFERDPENAFSLLLQAEYAIKMRREHFNYMGDDNVEQRVKDALEIARDRLPSDYFKERLEFDHPALIGALLRNSDGVDLCFVQKDDALYIVAKRVADDEDRPNKYLFCVPEMSSCCLADSVIMKVEDAEELKINSEDSHVFINHIDYNDRTKTWTFWYLDNPCISLRCAGFSLEK